jgi:hypothetical protein
MNIGDAVKVLWAGECSLGEVIGFDRGEAVIAFDSKTTDGAVVRHYQRIDECDAEPVIPVARVTPRQIPQHIIDSEREVYMNDPINRARGRA